MEVTGNIEDLQKAADFVAIRKRLRPSGIGSIIFGIIAVGIGIDAVRQEPLNAVLIIIGSFLFAEGIWIVVSPTPEGLIVDGIALLTIGVWNIVVTVLEIFRAAQTPGSAPSSSFLLLGLIQIGWGVKSFLQYKRFGYLSAEKPAEEYVKQVQEVVKKIAKANPKKVDRVIQFQGKGIWKALFSPDVAVFLKLGPMPEIVLARREEVNFAVTGKRVVGKNLKASFHIRNLTMTGTILPEYFQRCEAWKSHASAGQSAAA